MKLNTTIAMGLITLATLSFTACGDSKKADSKDAAAPAADAPAAADKKEAPAAKWPGKDKFIEQCSTSAGIKDMSKGNAAKAKDICSCLADKVEAKHPEGMDFEKAGKPSVIEEVGAQKCFE